MRLLVWIRENGLKQGVVAAAAGRSDAWLSKRVRDHRAATADDRELILSAARKLTDRSVTMADLFEDKAAA